MQFSGEAAGESLPLAAAALGEFDSQYNGNPPPPLIHLPTLQSSPHACPLQYDFHCSYLLFSLLGMRILPRKLRPELVDQLTWQSVLRAVLLRLEPVKQLRKIAQEVPAGVPQPDPTHLTWFAGI